MLTGLQIAQVRAIFTLPTHLQAPSIPTCLVYIEWFTPFRPPDPDTMLYTVSRSTRNHRHAAEIIPIENIISSCHLIPKYGTQYYPANWSSANVLEECKIFILNKYIHISLFYEHRIVPRLSG
jgi:hypothetical protein